MPAEAFRAQPNLRGTPGREPCPGRQEGLKAVPKGPPRQRHFFGIGPNGDFASMTRA